MRRRGAWLLVCCALVALVPSSARGDDPSAAARTQLVGILEDAAATLSERLAGTQGATYRARESATYPLGPQGYTLDAIKIIPSPGGGYLGVYHVGIGGQFSVRVATSTDLLHWTYRAQLQDGASQPTIAGLRDGGFLVSYERWEAGRSQLEFRAYASLGDLLRGAYSRQFDAPNTLSPLEGTPSIEGATLNPDIAGSRVEVGFHYFDTALSPYADRNALGVMTNFSAWSTRVASGLNGAFDPAPPGNIGDRDTVTFQGYRFTLIEAQSVNGDFGSWRVYVYDQSAHSLTPLSIRTPGGSTAFGNPTATVVNDPSGHRALVATLYVFSEGASDGEAGPLIYYKRF